jgi:hypothetical protein
MISAHVLDSSSEEIVSMLELLLEIFGGLFIVAFLLATMMHIYYTITHHED